MTRRSDNTPMPLRRYIFNTFTVVSLLLMLGAVGLWMDGYSKKRAFRLHHIEGFVWSNNRGDCSIGDVRFEQVGVQTEKKTILGFGISRTSQSLKEFIPWGKSPPPPSIWFFNEYTYIIPHWLLAIVFTTLPTIWLFKWNKRRKLGPNACLGCGYDLTGNESGVCPECGKSIGTEAAQI